MSRPIKRIIKNLSGILKRFIKSKVGPFALILLFVLISFWYILPDPLFEDPSSTAVFDKHGELLGARIADDGQWRFPESDSIPLKFRQCIINFEDRYFYLHPGVNPLSLGRALVQNIRESEIVSGGSTLTMQVIRLSRKDKPRTIKEKLIEIILAFRLEIQYTKEEIINLYASHAPFGGNVVGLETAAWRYFGTDPFNLSWGETACLAVLPNAPSLIHPGRNRESLLLKRNRLLLRLRERNIISEMDYKLAISEPLPEEPRELPSNAYHLTERFNITARGKRINSSIEKELQDKVNRTVLRSQNKLYGMGVRNAACLIVEVESGNILAYVGNIRNKEKPEYGGDVDIITSARSSGSILKPLLYAMMQYRGDILPQTIIADIPTRFGNYSPKNYEKSYDGIVTASDALARSLNVPAVRMLHQYGNERFLNDLRSMGMTTLDKPGDYYGLSLILGGAECSLEDLASIYSSMARVLANYTNSEGKYFRSDWRKVDPEKIEKSSSDIITKASGEEQGLVGAGSIWLTFEALAEVNRPASQTGWKIFSSSRKVAWKTGTSFGFRDGWAVGTTPEYLVAVWTGNADGEGRPGLTGLNAAAPILFDVLNILPETSWFDTPWDDLKWAETCNRSGHIAGRYCKEKDSTLISPAGAKSSVCPYHQLIHLDKDKKNRVNSSCYPVSSIIHEPWFVLPPLQEWYYRQKDPTYLNLPPLVSDCNDDEIEQMQLIYPDPGSVIYVPYELDGKKGRVIFEAAHRDPRTRIFWSINEEFIASTSVFHQISVLPEEGKHVLNLVDENGNQMHVKFEVIER